MKPLVLNDKFYNKFIIDLDNEEKTEKYELNIHEFITKRDLISGKVTHRVEMKKNEEQKQLNIPI